MGMPYYDDNAVDEAMKARNSQTQDNRSSNQSVMKNWAADASLWRKPRFQER